MKTTLRILPLMLGIMLFFTQCEEEADFEQNLKAEATMVLNAASPSFCNYTEQNLYAGAGQNNITNGELVGKVIAEIFVDADNGDELTIKVVYLVDEPWDAIEYHLWVGKEIKGPNGIPKNAAPGLFPFTGKENTIVLSDLSIDANDEIYIAAHAVVVNLETADANYDAIVLPEAVEFELLSFPGSVSYFDINIADGGMLTGPQDSWCIDPSLPIGPRASDQHPFYQADVYLSLGDLPSSYDEMDFGKVNWILNFAAPQVPANYSFGDVQTAIWRVLFGETYTVAGSAPSFDEANLTEILNNADSDYVPGCNDYVGIILYTADELQPIIVPFLVPCKGVEETAWAIGQHTFIDEKVARKWGWIVRMEYCPEE